VDDPGSRPDEMASKIDLLEALVSASTEAVEETSHPYERATETEREDYDRKIETVANQREARERAAASSPD
jgi:hypothetical protein